MEFLIFVVVVIFWIFNFVGKIGDFKKDKGGELFDKIIDNIKTKDELGLGKIEDISLGQKSNDFKKNYDSLGNKIGEENFVSESQSKLRLFFGILAIIYVIFLIYNYAPEEILSFLNL